MTRLTAISRFASLLELAIDEERLLLVRQWPPERPLGESPAEFAQLRLAVRRIVRSLRPIP